jgi:hypothetical protein
MEMRLYPEECFPGVRADRMSRLSLSLVSGFKSCLDPHFYKGSS